MSCDMDDLVTYFIVRYNDETYVREYQRAMHQKGLHATVVIVLDIGGINTVTSTLKSRNSVAVSTVPVTVVPRTLIWSPVCLARRKSHFSKAPWFLRIPWIFSSFASSRYFLPS